MAQLEEALESLKLKSPKAEIRRLVRWIKAEAKSSGLAQGIVGLSGGLDSAVICALGALALGPDKMHAVLMPATTSAPESAKDARRIARKLGVKVYKTAVGVVTDELTRILKCRGNAPDKKVRRGNVAARARMIVLWDYSLRLGALVLGTSNRSEILLGYGTLWGDAAWLVGPVASLLKTQMRELIDPLALPDFLHTKIPSADLWPGQEDEKDLGVTYAVADSIIHYHIDEGYSRKRLLSLGFTKAQIMRTLGLIDRMRYKSAGVRIPILPALKSTRGW